MITEQYVSFQTAQILEQAGFDEACDGAYYTDGKISYMGNINSTLPYGYISRPTQQLAARWLREVHHYAVCPWFSKDHEKWFYAHGNMQNIVFDTDYEISEYKYDTYEAALEAGLQQALKQISKPVKKRLK